MNIRKFLISISLGLFLIANPVFATQTQAKNKAVVTPKNPFYINISGNKIHTPIQKETPPAGASAKCRDDSYSFSQNRRGTCSHHGGVKSWLY